MPVRRGARRLAGVLLIVLVGALLGACGGPPAGSPAAAPPPAPPARTVTGPQWVEEFCAAIVSSVPAGVPAITKINPSDRATVTNALPKVIAAADIGIGKLGQLPASPFKGGDEAATSFAGLLTILKQSFVKARDKIAGLAPTDTAGAAAAFKAARDEVSEATKKNRADLSRFDDDPGLEAAFKSASSCKAIGAN